MADGPVSRIRPERVQVNNLFRTSDRELSIVSTLAPVNDSLARFGHAPEEPILGSQKKMGDQGRSLLSTILGMPARRKMQEGFSEHILGVSVRAI
jgi:hypothetical protein